MTASRVLRGSGSVKESTRERVLAAVRRLGGLEVAVGPLAKGLGRGLGSEQRLRVFFPHFRKPRTEPARELSFRFTDALRTVIEDSGGALVEEFCQSLEDICAVIEKSRFHAVVIRDSLPTPWFRELAKMTNVISAVANDFIPGCDCVFLNESRAATTIFQELNRLGHRRVVWFGINDYNYIKPLENVDPLRDSLGQVHVVRYGAWNSIASMGPSTELHRTLYLTRDHDRQSLDEVVGEGVKLVFGRNEALPTAIVTATEIMAVHLIKQLQIHGVKVPEDCSVVTYGRTSISQRHSPTLAGVRSNFDELALAVPELISRRLANPNARPISLALESDFEPGTSLRRVRKVHLL